MCFKNLPIEFDAEGNARLKEGLRDPWAIRRDPDRAQPVPYPRAVRGGRRAVTRVAGAHAFHTLVVHRGESPEEL